MTMERIDITEVLRRAKAQLTDEQWQLVLIAAAREDLSSVVPVRKD